MMNPYAAQTQAYRENSVMTATPEQLVVMLYDGAARFLRQAQAAMAEQAWLDANERLTRGEAIINELLATLDMDQGQVAERLQAIYVYCKRCLREARRERSGDKIALVVRLLGELREAWAQVAAAPTPVAS